MSKKEKTTETKTAEGQPAEDDGLAPFMKAKEEGNESVRKKEYQKAIDKYSEAIELCPPTNKRALAIFYQNRAAVYEFLGRGSYPENCDVILDQVIGDCSQAIALNSRYLKALRRRSKAFEKKGKLKEAAIDITAVCFLEQFQNEANFKKSRRLIKKLSMMKTEVFAQGTERTPSAQFVKNYLLSFTRDPLFPMVDGRPQVVTYDKLRLLEVDLITRSLNNLRIGLSTAQCDPHLLLLQGTINVLKGKHDVAKEQFQKVVQSTVESSLIDEELLNKLKSNAWIKLGDLQVNETSAKVIVPLNLYRPNIEASSFAERMYEALDNFGKAANLEPDNPDIYDHRAPAYITMKRYEDAYRDLAKCTILNPSSASAVGKYLYFQHSNMAVRQGNNTGLQLFREAIRRFPDAAELTSFYGLALMDSGKFEEADHQFLKASEIDPENAIYFVHRANIKRYRQFDAEGASKLFEEALKVDPQCYFALEHMAVIETHRGLRDGQVDHLNKAFELYDRALECCTSKHDYDNVINMRVASDVQFWANKLLGNSIVSTAEHLLPNHCRRSCAFCREIFSN